MSKRKEFRLEVPGFIFTQYILPEDLEDETTKNALKSKLRASIRENVKNWLKSEFDEFFEETIQENSERWEKEKYRFSDRLINKTD